MVTLFTCLIIFQFAVIVAHDLVDVPGLISGSQVQAVMGRRKVWLASIANAIFPGIAAAFAIYFWRHARPHYVSNYWVIYSAIAVLSAVGMWYVPYFVGAPQKIKEEYLRMYSGTRHVLPAHGDNPRPNLFHMGVHALFLTTLVVALVLRFHPS